MTTTPDVAGSAKALLDFWFCPEVEVNWFDASLALDRELSERFGFLYERAVAGDLPSWSNNAEGALALVILLDQFPRNMFRGSPRAFQSDDQARIVSRNALEKGFDQQRPPRERTFFYLPLMHSEDLSDQTECVALYRRMNDETGLDFARQHHDIIARFGRFPHRNEVLNRDTTAEEREFLKSHPGF